MGGTPEREFADDRLIDTLDHEGRPVVLTRGQWHAHVLSFKPYMSTHLDDVEQAITTPTYINRDAHPGFPHRFCHYGPYRSSNPRLMVKVVIDYHRDPGFVVTAYPCSRPGSGEVRIWTRQSP